MAEAILWTGTSYFEEKTIAPDSELTAYEYNRQKITNGIYPYVNLGAIDKVDAMLKLEAKKNSFYQFNDIIGVWDNEFFKTKDNPRGAGWRKDIHALLIVKNAKREDFKEYLQEYEISEVNRYFRQYKLDYNTVSGEVIEVDNMKDISFINKALSMDSMDKVTI